MQDLDKFYAYIYCDPSRNYEPIYAGKGIGKRAWQILSEETKMKIGESHLSRNKKEEN